MPDRDPYLTMALNNAWANTTLYGALKGMDSATFQAPRPGFFGSLERTLNHIYEVDLYYIDALEAGGLGRSVFRRDDIADPATLGAAQAEADMRLAMFCQKLTPEVLTATRATERREGHVDERVDALLLHLFQHQIHHRGQAHVQLSDAGIAPPQLDDFHLDHERAETAKAYFA
ncbi:MAG: DinB family protein [Pseudomonadota bacterium]